MTEKFESDALTVFNELLAGHQRYLTQAMEHPNSGSERREKTKSSQAPKVCILACADSRVPPELIFDQGIGDMFVIRVAGNFADDYNQASLEYAVAHFEPAPSLIIVLGHQRCGAIQGAAITLDEKSVDPAAVTKFYKHGKPSALLGKLVEELKPAIVNTRVDQPTTADAYADRISAAVRWNIKANVTKLQDNPVISRSGAFVIGAHYLLDTGELEWLTATPPLILDATTLDLKNEEAVSTWAGRSTTGTPTYTADQAPNDKPVVVFEYGDRMDDITLDPSPAGDWILVAVISPDHVSTRLSLVDADDDQPQLRIDTASDYELNGAGGTGTKYAGYANGWDIVMVDSQRNELYVNSPTSNGTGGGARSFTSHANFHLLHNRNAEETYQGMVAELRIYTDRASFGGDFARLYNDMRAKWFEKTPAEHSPAGH
jgi:carbonic anhydrase